MFEVLSALCRFLALLAASALIGGAVYQRWCLRNADLRELFACNAAPWRFLTIPALILIAAHLGQGIGLSGTIIESVPGAPGRLELMTGTNVGRVWMFRAFLLLPLVLLLVLMRLQVWRQSFFALLLGLGLSYLATAIASGHAIGSDTWFWAASLNAVHISAAAIWIGALPLWLAATWAVSKGSPAVTWSELVQAQQRFSRLATVLLALTLATGLGLSLQYVETTGDALGTRYGLLLLLKFCLLSALLLPAYQARRVLLPGKNPNDNAVNPATSSGLLRWVGLEFGIGMCILCLAAWLAQTTPALHDDPHWPFAWRLSLEAAWEEPRQHVLIVASAALALLLMCGGLFAGKAWRRGALLLAGTISALTFFVLIAVEAYPETYRRSKVPYVSVSIAQGQRLFEAHCVSCHGSGGLGDGPLADELPAVPANLSEPHTALHTAGDMYWWLSQGIPDSGMPGFGQALDETDYWDLINFLRAFSQGFQGRLLGPSIIPMQAWLGAPNVYLQDSGTRPELVAYREDKNVLLAFLGPSEAGQARARILTEAAPRLAAMKTQVLIVPINAAQFPQDIGHPVVRSGADEFWGTYQLLARTRSNRGSESRVGMPWDQTEFLIDRFGYIRARWIPEEGSAWNRLDMLFAQIQALNLEPRLEAPPDEHVH